METRRKKQTQRQKNLFTSGGSVIVVTNNSFNDSKLFRAYLKGGYPYHLCVTKSAAVADFVYTSESNEGCEKHSTQR